jgi:hypothetical protein
MAAQKRHWISTVHFTHLGVVDGEEEAFGEALAKVWDGLNADTRLRYATGQLERGEGGRLHAQIYTEWKVSMRRSQVAKVLPSHLEPVRGTRTQAREYCRKSEGRVLTLPELGEWRPERGDSSFGTKDGPKARAIALITEKGMHPIEIAQHDPEAYFTFSTAIHRLYEALKLAGALPKVLPEAGHLPRLGEEE